jgi:hypothetical protein
MGCGPGKHTKETILASTVPAAGVSRDRFTPNSFNAKLPPEVLEGFTALFRRFTIIEVSSKSKTGKGKGPAIEQNGGKEISGGSATMQPPQVEGEKKLADQLHDKDTDKKSITASAMAPREESKVEPLSLPDSAASYPVLIDHVVAEDHKESSVNHAEISGVLEPKEAFGGIMSSGLSEDQRFSPEPPRPENLSEDEAQPYEDETLRKARLERERLAQIEAERKAAEEREAVDNATMQQRGKMTAMEDTANSILSKYQ